MKIIFVFYFVCVNKKKKKQNKTKLNFCITIVTEMFTGV